jgi:predicted aspartyl protease
MDQEGPESTDKPQGKTFTPAEWFEKGRALDDESEAEVEYYEKAIALDPEFAPAYFRLGAIQYRRANHELADQQFAKFLKYASEADKEAYNIYVYYSPADVERLSEDKEEKQIPTEEVRKETPSKTEEVKKETSSETEGAEEETDLESEEEEEETPWETEGDQKEASSEDEEETGEEESEEVMTIVRFFPVDGHVVVPALFNGHVEARVLVDTGSGITVLSRELAEQIQLEEEPGNGITLKTMAMDIQAGLATLNSIQVGDLIQNNLHVAITDVPSGEEQKFDAILGMDFLNKYEIHIDNQNNRIELRSVREEK